MISDFETIAAISTAMNNSGIGIIRMSGPDSFNIISRIFRPAIRDVKDIFKESHRIFYGYIYDDEIVIDEVLVLIMKAPHTYTREDTVEIDCHGGMFVMNKVLELVLRSGARTAQPGEFTKRAFINGRIDLSQAEAVTDVINAENDFALQSAQTQLRGSVSEKIRSIRSELLEKTAYIEAALDDPEHYELDGFGSELLPVINDCEEKIQRLIDTAQDGRIIKEGIRTVILGKPNVGKSSFLNALLGMQRAIVTQIPGTTRDAIEESIRLSDITLNIVDTAGIRKTQDEVEKIGVDKAREYASGADLIVWVVDASSELDENDHDTAELVRGRKAIVLLNKSDLPQVTDEKDIIKVICKDDPDENVFCVPVIRVSALKNQGTDDFTSAVRKMFYSKEINFNDQVYITNARQKEALINSLKSLQKAKDSVRAQMPEDFFTIDLMDTYSYLGKVIGESLEDDLADEIFSKFCMGK